MKNLSVLVGLFLALGYASAQSLKPEDPAPLKAGINKGTVATGAGAQYWYFIGGPGDVRFVAHLKSHDGFAWPAALTVTLYDEKRAWHMSKVVTEQNADQTFIGKLEKKQKTIVSVAPPSGISLITSGGNYELEATGEVQFEEAKVTRDPIIRTFVANGSDYGATKFLADGTIVASDGSHGTWKVFDPENRIYTVVIEGTRFSLQYVPGRGLVDARDATTVRFLEVR
jgi:CubicO group peptidase (beta-lactamase class C family)